MPLVALLVIVIVTVRFLSYCTGLYKAIFMAHVIFLEHIFSSRQFALASISSSHIQVYVSTRLKPTDRKTHKYVSLWN